MGPHRSRAAALLLLLAGTSVHAQNVPEVIRGKITADSGRVVSTATIMVTRGPDRLTQQTTTDSAGRYLVRFEQGTGDYLVYVTAAGFKGARRRVRRQTNEHEFVADFSLTRDVALLDTMKVTADKAVRARNDVRPIVLEPGSAEKWMDGVNGAIPPSSQGDPNPIPGTMSHVTITGLGPSILVAGLESNLTTVIGMALAGGDSPPAAHTPTPVTAAPFEPTRVGISGANIDLQLVGGDQFVQLLN